MARINTWTDFLKAVQPHLLASDPLGRGWNLFGTAGFYPDIGIVDARFTWYVAIGAIVAGHVISIWLAHRLALRELGASLQAAIASVPLTILMVIYTAISLSVISNLALWIAAKGIPTGPAPGTSIRIVSPSVPSRSPVYCLRPLSFSASAIRAS